MAVLPLQFGPWLPDLPQIDLNGLVTAHNVVSDHGGYGPLAGAMVYADTTLSSRPLGATAGQDRHGNAMVFAGCSTKLARIREFPVRCTRASIGTYYDASGVVRTAQPNEARLDHNPATGEPRGYLEEPTFTNVVRRSTDFAQSTWSKTRVTVESRTSERQPNGEPADFVRMSEAGNNCYWSQSNVPVVGEPYFIAAEFKPSAATSVFRIMTHQNQFSTNRAVRFDVATGEVSVDGSGGGEVLDFGCETLAQGWFRLWIIRRTTADAASHFPILWPTNVAVDEGFWIGNVDVGIATSRQSQVYTTTAAVTRAEETTLRPGLHWDDISRPEKYSTTDGERWRFASFGNLQIATNFSDPVQAMDKNDHTTFRNLTDEVRARYVMALDNFVVVANTRDDYDGDVPIRVRWSGIGDPGYWAVNPTGEFDRTKMSDHQDISGYGNITGLVGGEDGIVLLQKGIVRMTFVGGAAIFQFKPIVEGKGCSVPNSVVTVEGRTFFLDDDGFYMYAAGQVVGIGDGKVNDYFKRNSNSFYHDRMSVECDPTRSLVYWLYASNASTEGVPDKLIIYNYATNNWSEGEATPAVMLFRSLSLPETIESLDRYGSIEMVPASFDSPLFAGGRTQLAGLDREGRLLTLAGPARPATLRIGEIEIADPIREATGPSAPNSTRALTRRTRPMLHAGGSTSVTVSIRHRNMLTEMQSETPPQSLHRGETFHRTDARYQQLVVRTSGEFEKLIGIKWDATLTGRS